MDEQTAIFLEEAKEILSEIETDLLRLEQVPEDVTIIQGIFRGMHTIKGSARMFGFDNVATLAHEVETVFDRIRNHELTVGHLVISTALSSCDQLLQLIMAEDPNDEKLLAVSGQIVSDIQLILRGEDEAEVAATLPAAAVVIEPESEEGPVAETAPKKIRQFCIHLNADKIADPSHHPLLAVPSLEELGECFISNSSCQDDDGAVSYELILSSSEDKQVIKELLKGEAAGNWFFSVEEVKENDLVSLPPKLERLGEILLEMGVVSNEDLKKVLRQQKPLGRQLIDAGLVSAEQVNIALRRQSQQQQATNEILKQRRMSRSVKHQDRSKMLFDLTSKISLLQKELAGLSGEIDDKRLAEINARFAVLSEQMSRTIMKFMWNLG